MRKALIAVAVIYAGAAQADEVVIAAFGDSLTQGYGLPAEQGFVPQLQGWLEGQGADVRLINAGVSGDTTAGGLARVAWTLSPEVDAMIVALGANDILRGLAPEAAKANLAGILQAAQAEDVEVLLVGMLAPGNYGADYKASFDAIYPALSAQFEVPHVQSFFVGLMEDGTLPELSVLQPYFQSDGLHPNAAGVVRIVDGLGPHVLNLIAEVEAG